jgi:hypothetical protein
MKKTSKRFVLGAAGALLATLTSASLVLAAAGEASFTPTGLSLSIMSVTLSATSEGGQPMAQQVLYACPHATEGE